MPVTSMTLHFSSTPPRKEPKTGDLRETKKHGKQVRLHRVATDFHGRPFGYVVTSRGKLCYEWVSYEVARKRGAGCYLPKEEPCPSTKPE